MKARLVEIWTQKVLAIGVLSPGLFVWWISVRVVTTNLLKWKAGGGFCFWLVLFVPRRQEELSWHKLESLDKFSVHWTGVFCWLLSDCWGFGYILSGLVKICIFYYPSNSAWFPTSHDLQHLFCSISSSLVTCVTILLFHNLSVLLSGFICSLLRVLCFTDCQGMQPARSLNSLNLPFKKRPKISATYPKKYKNKPSQTRQTGKHTLDLSLCS